MTQTNSELRESVKNAVNPEPGKPIELVSSAVNTGRRVEKTEAVRAAESIAAIVRELESIPKEYHAAVRQSVDAVLSVSNGDSIYERAQQRAVELGNRDRNYRQPEYVPRRRAITLWICKW